MKLIRQYKHGLPTPKELLEQSENLPIEEAGVRLRSLMPRVEKEKHQGGAGSLLIREHYSLTFWVDKYHLASHAGRVIHQRIKLNMKLPGQESINAVTSSAATPQLPEQNAVENYEQGSWDEIILERIFHI